MEDGGGYVTVIDSSHCLYSVLKTQETSHFYWQWFNILKNKLRLKYKRNKNPTSPFRVTCWLARPIQPKRLVRPGQLAGNSERSCGIFFLFYIFIFIYFLKYETIVSRNGLSLGYSERDTSSVGCQLQYSQMADSLLLLTLSFWLIKSWYTSNQISNHNQKWAFMGLY